jgi:hypothetical protein
MPIREPAAEKLARKLLELRAPRLSAPSPEFYPMMAKVIMLYVEMDEQRQRTEKILGDIPDERLDGSVIR